MKLNPGGTCNYVFTIDQDGAYARGACSPSLLLKERDHCFMVPVVQEDHILCLVYIVQATMRVASSALTDDERPHQAISTLQSAVGVEPMRAGLVLRKLVLELPW